MACHPISSAHNVPAKNVELLLVFCSWIALFQKGGIMRLEEVRNIAKSRGVHPDSLTKTKLIKALQAKEGSFDCFATAVNGDCDQMGCLWREDCFDAVRKGELS
jgi:hypothetical protein